MATSTGATGILGGLLSGLGQSISGEVQAASDQLTQAVYAILGEGAILIVIGVLILARIWRRT